jgi:SMI1 / KNR4 family (SUKH-1)
MATKTAGDRLRDALVSQGVVCGIGVTERRIAEFERRNKVHMPSDLKSYFAAMNGWADAYGDGVIRFWSLEEFRSVADEVPGDTPPTAAVIQAKYQEPIADGEHYFVFADALHEAQLYAIDLAPPRGGLNDVALLDGTEPSKVADSFSHFVELYLSDPSRLRLFDD